MTIYILLLIAIFLYALLIKINDKSRYLRILFLFLSFGSCALVLGLRAYSVGEDTGSYINIFNFSYIISLHDIFANPSIRIPYFVDYNSSAPIESGFLLWCKLIHVFSNNQQVFLFLTAALTCFLFAKFIYDNCGENVFFPTIVFLCESIFMNSFNLVRQMLACAIAIQAYTLLKNNKFLKATTIIIIAFLVHHTAVITILLLPLFGVLSNSKNQKHTFKYISIIGFLVPFFLLGMKNIISTFFPDYSSYYLNGGLHNYIGFGTAIFIVIEIAGIICMYHSGFRINESAEISALTILAVAFELSGLKLTILLRMALYFRAYLLLFFNKLFKTLNPKYKVFVQFGVLCLLIVFYLSYANTPARRYNFFM